ncbi:PilZ domain-containing protein [Tuwongella immobilis]|uniref:Type iv pilus assembly:: PilZ n=1 Tax=Tuwongella immobilis TaxID=692036 RepID=A0A6C2YN91_9BACT|nr:PilZ domain-containing protein [Tuwongella immobilis]VIP02906.1 type iv pilus assembly : : PilZ [Tuwongella immobilis]VTS02806.1 type iv pilus assembly : : PilZ [Tuwongella immobilis]
MPMVLINFWAVGESELLLGLIVLLGMMAIILRIQAWQQAMHSPTSTSPTGMPATLPEFTRERRRFTRRDGTPVAVRILDNSTQSVIEDAVILDRSQGGVRIAVPDQLPIGTEIQIRVQNAGEVVPWVLAIVRNLRFHENRYEIGCEFDGIPPSKALETFG